VQGRTLHNYFIGKPEINSFSWIKSNGFFEIFGIIKEGNEKENFNYFYSGGFGGGGRSLLF